MLGGQIGAMSKAGAGSTFWFTVPLLLPDMAPPPGLCALMSSLFNACHLVEYQLLVVMWQTVV